MRYLILTALLLSATNGAALYFAVTPDSHLVVLNSARDTLWKSSAGGGTAYNDTANAHNGRQADSGHVYYLHALHGDSVWVYWLGPHGGHLWLAADSLVLSPKTFVGAATVESLIATQHYVTAAVGAKADTSAVRASLAAKLDTNGVAANSKLLQGQDTTALWNAKTLQGYDTTGLFVHGIGNAALLQGRDTNGLLDTLRFIKGHSRTSTATGANAWAAGLSNTASGAQSTVGGGNKNYCTTSRSTIAGGDSNSITSNCGTVAGGYNNRIGGYSSYATIGGGYTNLIRSASPGALGTTIAGGYDNKAYGQYGTIAGGYNNYLDTNAIGGFIGGGLSNRMMNGSDAAMILGSYNQVVGSRGKAIGDNNLIPAADTDAVVIGKSATSIGKNTVKIGVLKLYNKDSAVVAGPLRVSGRQSAPCDSADTVRAGAGGFYGDGSHITGIGGSGTVTAVRQGYGLTFSKAPLTDTGTVGWDSTGAKTWLAGESVNAVIFNGRHRGTFIGNVTGDVSGSSGSCTGNAATATTAGACSGNAATVTNGVYTSGDQTIGGTKTFSSKITGSINGNADGSSGSCTGNAATATTAGACSGNAATVTNGVYANARNVLTGSCQTLSATSCTLRLISGTDTSLWWIDATDTVRHRSNRPVDWGGLWRRFNGTTLFDTASGNAVTITRVHGTADSATGAARAALLQSKDTSGLRTMWRHPLTCDTASTATPCPNADACDQYDLTALAAGATFAVPAGTPVSGQKLIIRILDNGGAQTLAWASGTGGYASSIATLPTTTTPNKRTYVGLIYNTTAARWQCVAAGTEP